MSGASNKVGSEKEYVDNFDRVFAESKSTYGLATAGKGPYEFPVKVTGEMPIQQVVEFDDWDEFDASQYETVAFRQMGQSAYQALTTELLMEGVTVIAATWKENAGAITVESKDFEKASRLVSAWGVLDV